MSARDNVIGSMADSSIRLDDDDDDNNDEKAELDADSEALVSMAAAGLGSSEEKLENDTLVVSTDSCTMAVSLLDTR
jgi:hypothetical protein